jgi:UDP-N-acetylglucosamine--N-acetylmuramyl-(pentapeptide) pyrophosphoryl-undecaprenol N-acetylglucosamine transferase
MTLPDSSQKLLIAASGTGGHLFPAIATAEQLSTCQIEWLGVPDRLETQLVPDRYPLHTIAVGGFQTSLSLSTLRTASGLTTAVLKVRKLLKTGKFQAVFTTGGYIAAPAILAARSLGLPVVLHESNVLPGKVTRWFAPLCRYVAIGFEETAKFLPKAQTVYTGTPVRPPFRLDPPPPLTGFAIPDNVPLIGVVGGSQGAVAVNQMVRQAAPAWLEAGAWLVHQTGENDPDVDQLQHPHYIHVPFYDNMAALFQRANLIIGRAGAGTLTELAISQTPSILIPYPYAAENHQTYNARVFEQAGAAHLCRQTDLMPELLQSKVLFLLNHPEILQQMADATGKLAVANSAELLAALINQAMTKKPR